MDNNDYQNEPILNAVQMQIAQLILSGTSIISIVSLDETQTLSELELIRQWVVLHDIKIWNMAPDEEADFIQRGRRIVKWTLTRGVEDKISQEAGGGGDPTHALRLLDNRDDDNWIYVLQDFHPYIDTLSALGNPSSPVHFIVRKLRDFDYECREDNKGPGLNNLRTIIILSPVRIIPPELEKQIQLIEYPLPSEEQLNQHFTQLRRKAQIPVNLTDEDHLEIVKQLKGLLLFEVDGVVDRIIAQQDELNRDVKRLITEEKKQIIQKTGLLEYFPVEDQMNFDQVGGLDGLKKWLKLRKDAFTGRYQPPEDFKLPDLRGILLTGIPGTGKSLSAKAVAAEWGVPLVRFDVGRIYEPLLGKSDENMRRVIKIAESLAPLVFWIDEIEKALPLTTSTGDSGASARTLGSFLNWMQERKAPVFVVATANDITKMPPELTRKGRFDEIFFVGLPDKAEREAIFRIHLERWGLKQVPDENIQDLAERTDNFTGSEIEQAVKNTLWALPSPDSESSLLNIPLGTIIDNLRYEVDNITPMMSRSNDNRLANLVLERSKNFAISASGKSPVTPTMRVRDHMVTRRGMAGESPVKRG